MFQLSLLPDSKKGKTAETVELAPFKSDDSKELRLSIEEEINIELEMRYHPEIYSLAMKGACSSRLGDWAEHKAASFAMSKGADVYRNVSCVGPADIVIRANDLLFAIDVKLSHRRFENGRKPRWCQTKASSIRRNVYGVMVIPAASGIWYRWFNVQVNKYRCDPIHPPGLRDFWAPAVSCKYLM